jgi:competence protein ComK
MLENNYLINKETVYFYGEFDKEGQLSTRFIRGYNSYCVNVSPQKLIDESLKKFGSSLRGSLDGSKEIIGNKNMRPIVINAYLGIFLFPSKSPNKPDCVWFSLLHVLNTESIDRNKTKVYLSYGHTLIIDMKESNFNRRLNRTLELRRKISENMKIPITFYLEQKFHSRFVISRGRK